MKQQPQPADTFPAEIIWIGWIIVFFCFGVWVGRFYIDRTSSPAFSSPVVTVQPSSQVKHCPSPRRCPPPRHCPPPKRYISAITQKQSDITFSDLSGIAWQRLSLRQRRYTLGLIKRMRLPCHCGETFARCLQKDLRQCPRTGQAMKALLSAINQGKVTEQTSDREIQQLLKPIITPSALSSTDKSFSLKEDRVYYLPVGKAPSQGPSTAKLTVVFFADFQCLYSRQAHKQITALRKKYGEKEVRVIFRHFPLPTHLHAQRMAKASMAAHAQGKFWSYQGKLFEGQQVVTEDLLAGYAKVLKLDIKKFKDDMKNHRYKNIIQRDIEIGQRFKLPGTPFFFINGMPVLTKHRFFHVASTAWKHAELYLKKGGNRYRLYDSLMKYSRRYP